ncbi:MAG: chemotaxis protein CheB [Pseudomonadota bacterium]
MPRTWSYVVAIGASAGGIKAVSSLIAGLPANFAAPVLVAIHSKETLQLPEILDRRSAMSAELLSHDSDLLAGRIYVCPGGKQSYFSGDRMTVSDDRQGDRFTPSVNMLFESMAREHGIHAIAVVMSGMLNDGVLGAQSLTRCGSKMFVQLPCEAEHDSMPNSVILNDEPLEVLPAAEIANALVRIAGVT